MSGHEGKPIKHNLCLVISTLASGGAQRVVSRLARGLAADYNIYLVLHDGKKIDYPPCGQLIDLRTPVASSAAGKVMNFLKRLVRLRRVRAELKPLAVISFLESSNFINLLSGRRGKRVISVRNYKSQQGRSPLGRLFQAMIRVLYRRSTLIVVPSAGIKADLVSAFQLEAGRIRVIPNPYDLEEIKRLAAEPLSGELAEFFSGPVLLTAGSLTRQKGQGHLVRAFSAVRQSRPDLKLVILGEGPQRPYLEELLEKYDLTGKVLMPGFQANPFKVMSRADFFVLPSIFEGFPNVLVEAMTCGLPVLSCDCPSGPREILDPDSDITVRAENLERAPYGLLCPPLSGERYPAEQPLTVAEKKLAEAILLLGGDEALKAAYRLRGLERAAQFECSAVVRQWVEALEMES